MRARVLFAGLVAISTVVVAGPASAKAIAEANITGPGLRGALTIEASDTEGLWDSGIDVGGLDVRAGSVEELD
jgi:hypothetical protein